ncbi:MAG: pentapeptide repeat-containing protein [Deltaproteobacteria bacterium]|jgi:hypothetical protein|nr:pentapeptide repeat-containing protein [Deltaproteobacteria bacterium]
MADGKQLNIFSRGAELWNAWRKEHPEISIDLTGANLRHLNLENADLSHADLTGANLSFSNFKNANLTFACLDGGILSFASFREANLTAAILDNTYLEDADLQGARLAGASLKNAILTNSNLKNSYLVDAHLDGSNLSAVNLENTNLSSVTFDQNISWNVYKQTGLNLKKIWKRRYDILLDTTMRCKGVNATTCYGSQMFKLFLQDQDFLEEFLDKPWGKQVFIIWWLFADCGRSLVRWAGWSLLLACCFAAIFWTLGPKAFDTQHLNFGFITMFYYSVVTFTTLGFGDIIPKTSTAALWVTLEVILGYVMLGGLITIFASKLSRRGG